MHAVIADRRQEISELCRRFGVRRLEAMGSAARGLDFDPVRSDADFLVEFAPNPDLPPLRQYFGFAEAMQSLLRVRVDLVGGQIANPYVRRSVDEDRELVFAA